MGKGNMFGRRGSNTGDRASDEEAACDLFAYLSVFMCCFGIPIFVGGICMINIFSGSVRLAGIALVALSCTLLVVGIIMIVLIALGCCNTSRWKKKTKHPVVLATQSAPPPSVIAPITVVTTGVPGNSAGQMANQQHLPQQIYAQPPPPNYGQPQPPTHQPQPSQPLPIVQQPYNYA